MWKTSLKLFLNKFIQKAKIWLTETGFTNIVYLALALGLLFGIIPIGMIGLGFLKKYLIGAFLGIFCYLNWNIIVKLYKTHIGDKINDKLDDITEKL
jgi:hypothetical protein